MTKNLLNYFFVFICGVFIIEGIRMPAEEYDIIGPALWPMSISICALLLLLAVRFTQLTASKDAKKTKSDSEAMIVPVFCIASIALISALATRWIPFFSLCTIYISMIFWLLSEKMTIKLFTITSIGSITFSYAIQWLFTKVMVLNLPT